MTTTPLKNIQTKLKDFFSDEEIEIMSEAFKINQLKQMYIDCARNRNEETINKLKSKLKEIIANKNEKQSAYKAVTVVASKNGRVIDKSVMINIPVLEVGKERINYPKNHKFEYISVDYKGLLKFFEHENLARSKQTGDLLENFEKLPQLNIKNIKNIRGHEGEHCKQCSIYLGNKKVAFYNGYEWFSDSEIEIENKDLMELTYDDVVFKTLGIKINKDNFIKLINVMCDLKKAYKMIV